MKTCIVIPSAGLSSRHPPNKLLLKAGDKTFIETTVEKFVNLPTDIYVITGYQAQQMTDILDDRFGSRISVICNPDYRNGMSTSIVAGVNSLKYDYEYIGIYPGDKPFIRKDTLQKCLSSLEKALPLISAPYFNSVMGHPCFFHKSLKNELMALKGDIGGRTVVENHKDRMLPIPVDDPGIITDLDSYLK